MGKFLSPMPHLHYVNLCPSGTVFEDIAFKISLNKVPMNSLLKGLFRGWRKKLFVRWYVMIVGHDVILKCGNVAVVHEDGSGWLYATTVDKCVDEAIIR